MIHWTVSNSSGYVQIYKKKKKEGKRKKQAQCDKRDYTKLIKYICIMTNHTL